MRSKVVASTAALALLAGACAPQGKDYTARFELWAGWVESEVAPGACEANDALAEVYDSDAEVALLDTEGVAVARAGFERGFIDRSFVAQSRERDRPSRVCVWELEFRNVPELRSYRILWPNGTVGTSFDPSQLEELYSTPIYLKAGWTPDSE